MQRESPTDATVTVHLSTTTNVTVVPEVSPEENNKEKRNPSFSLYLNHIDNMERIEKDQKSLKKCRTMYLYSGNPCQSSQNLQLMPEVKLEATHPAQVLEEKHPTHDLTSDPLRMLLQHSHCAHQKSGN